MLALVPACTPASISPAESIDRPLIRAQRSPSAESPPAISPPGTAPTEIVPFGQSVSRELLEGSAARGEVLFGPAGEFCSGCHSQLQIGPPMGRVDQLPAVAERARDWLSDPSYSGAATTPVEYLVESIVDPDAFTVPGYPAGSMPDGYGLLLSVQDVSDLVAYLMAVE